jgi:hypothetical protein
MLSGRVILLGLISVRLAPPPPVPCGVVPCALSPMTACPQDDAQNPVVPATSFTQHETTPRFRQVLATIATVTETTALLGNSTVYLVDTAPSASAAGDPLALGLQAPPVTDTPGSATASHPEIPSVGFAGVLTALRVLWTITTTIAVGVVVALATLAGWAL